jgi:hypothetical protein
MFTLNNHFLIKMTFKYSKDYIIYSLSQNEKFQLQYFTAILTILITTVFLNSVSDNVLGFKLAI